MNKFLKTLILASVFCLPAAAAFCVEFTFDIPVMKAPPRIISVTNSVAIEGNGSFTVYADIQGAVQNEICCNGVCQHECEPDCDFSACDTFDFYGEPDPRITPNPTCIPNTVDSSGGTSTSICQKNGITNPKLYYYYQDNPATMASTGMTYDASTGIFKGEIPIGSYAEGDLVTYFIAASDSRGNVVTQVPSTTDVPCNSSAAYLWTSTLATPAVDNCATTNSYEQCGKFKSGTPSCSSVNTVNDPTGDTCDSTGNVNTSGNQNKLDITGISAGIGVGFSELIGQRVVCSKVILNTNSPDIGDNSTPIGAYIMTFYNPDIVDPNPYDPYIPNSYAITYAAGISGVDANLVKVLWDGECGSSPDTPDLLACKLMTGGSNESRLKISAGDKSLLFIAQDSLPNGKTIVGTSSRSVIMSIQSGAIQLDGGTPFWTVDSSAGLTVVQKNQGVTICSDCSAYDMASPLVDEVQTCINGDGVSFVDGECGNAAAQGTNTCRLTIMPSPDAVVSDEYRIYRATTNSVNNAVANGVLATISSNLTSTNTYDDVISTLDGKTYYYFFSAYGSMIGKETSPSKMLKSTCTVEDWVPPEPPQNLACSTPDGSEGKCYCSWTTDTVADPYIRKFRIVRDTTEITDSLSAKQGVSSYSYTDSSLNLSQTYTYNVSAVDARGNESSPTSATCVPEDLSPPTKVTNFSVFNVPGTTALDANVWWNGVADEDTAYYNIYKCANVSLETSCTTFPHENWIKTNSSPITHSASGAEHTLEITDVPDTGSKDFEGDYCFWVEACDNCVTAGTCEGTEPNCSGFDTQNANRVCVLITDVVDPYAPATPTNVVAYPLPEGKACKLTWNRVETHSDGTPFDNPSNPNNGDLDKYAIMRATLAETLNTNPFASSPVGTAAKAYSPRYTDTGLTNGTTYQYYVIAYDSNQNFSDPQPIITTCTPEDLDAPTPPVLTVQTGNSDTSCDLSWSAVQDTDSVTYDVYRCIDVPSKCTSAGDFPPSAINGQGVPYWDIPGTQLTDFDVVLTSMAYTYCVVAKDPSGNVSDMFGYESSASDAGNCGLCAEAPEPPYNVSVSPYSSSGANLGMMLNYANSPAYAGSGNTGSHNLYYFSSAECGTEFEPDSECGLSTTLIASVLTADYSSVSYSVADLELPDGIYYFALSYKNSLGVESELIASPNSISITHPFIDSCDVRPVPWSCSITVSITGKYEENKLVKCTFSDPDCKTGVVKAVKAPYAGATVRVVNNSTGYTVKEVFLEPDGSVPALKLNAATEVSPGTDYKIVLHVPAASYTGLYGECENSAVAATEGCDIVVSPPQTFNPNNTVTGAAKTIPKARLLAGESAADVFIGNGGDIGNANGDDSVNLSDLSAMKTAFGMSAGNQCYRAWADFNLDGVVNLSDLTIMKEHFGKSIPVADGETIAPTLTRSNAPFKGTADECCLSNTCQ